MAGRHQHLRHLAAEHVGAEPVLVGWAGLIRGDRQRDRRASVPQPDLGCVDPVPVRALVRFEKEVDGGTARPLAASGFGAPGLPVPAAFGMRLQRQASDDASGSIGVVDR